MSVIAFSSNDYAIIIVAKTKRIIPIPEYSENKQRFFDCVVNFNCP